MNDMTFDHCFQQVDAFVAASAAGATTVEDVARFDALLAENELAREVYVDHLLATLALPSVMARLLPHEPFSEQALESADREWLVALPAQPESWGRRLKRALRDVSAHPYFIPAVSASLFLAAVLLTLAAIPHRQRQPIADAVEPATNIEVVAFIRKEVDAVWAEEGGKRPASLLRAGDTLMLEEGMVELIFRGGSKVVLQGPCSFTPLGPTLCELSVGRALARVDDPDAGFAIRTPTALIVDLGTEFLVDTQDDGQTTTHVVSGEVAVESRNEQSPQRTIVTAGGTVRIAQDGQPVRVFEEQTPLTGFAHMQALLDRPAAAGGESAAVADGGLPLEGLALWLAADKGTAQNEAGHVQFWRDVRRSGEREPPAVYAPEETSAPLWVGDGMAGRPALRFDGDDVLRLPGAGEALLANTDYEYFVVARTESRAVQFLVAGGFTCYELHINSPGARFIPAAPYDVGRASDLGEDGQYADGQPHLFAARVDRDLDMRGIVRVDGVDSPAATTAAATHDDPTPLQFGMRAGGSLPLMGEIAEILIYTRSLTEPERAVVERYLAEKYQLTLPEEIANPEKQ